MKNLMHHPKQATSQEAGDPRIYLPCEIINERYANVIFNLCIMMNLTPNKPLIHPFFTCSKWNMDDLYGLKFHLSYVPLVNDRNHYFGFGPIPKPKPKLVDTFGRYRFPHFKGKI